MLEIELKASLEHTGMDWVEQAVVEMGFVLEKEEVETDLYFNGNNRDFRRTDEALRLRGVKNAATGAQSNLITYKGSRQDAVLQTREELETEVGNMDTARLLLERLGYTPILSVEKSRRLLTGSYGGSPVTACLDRVKDLGDFLELEILVEEEDGDGAKKEAAKGQLLSLLEDLGIPRERLVGKTYLELLMERRMSKKSSQGM